MKGSRKGYDRGTEELKQGYGRVKTESKQGHSKGMACPGLAILTSQILFFLHLRQLMVRPTFCATKAQDRGNKRRRIKGTKRKEHRTKGTREKGVQEPLD